MAQKHYLFDFDGTLVDSMSIWAGAHIKVLGNNSSREFKTETRAVANRYIYDFSAL